MTDWIRAHVRICGLILGEPRFREVIEIRQNLMVSHGVFDH